MRGASSWRIVVGMAAVVWLLMVGVSHAETRVALVVGNANYEHTARLNNPRHDAEAMAATLQRLGFKVSRGDDLTHREALDLLREFGRQAEGADVAVFYYAGHALQVDGQNYLVPVDARLKSERDLRYEGLPLSDYLDELNQAQRLRVAILDACRDNPLATGMARGSRSAVVGRGLARVDASTPDTLIVYATAADAVAEDGRGRNSPFTTALLKHIERPGLDVRLMLGAVRDEVQRATNGRQIPFHYGSLGGEPWAFNPGAAPAVVPLPAVPDGTQALEYWNQVKDSRNPDALRAFLARFEDPLLRALAEERLRALEASAAGAAVTAGSPTAWLIVRSNAADDTWYLNDQAMGATGPQAHSVPPGVHRVRITKAGYRAVPLEEEIKLAAGARVTVSARLEPEAAPAAAGPTLVRISGGCYQMGSPTGEAGRDDDERQHRVCV
ncbi:MAG: PEGA domain-containing protein, partial [Opitutae bacterium]|nr:PEGA domain-containing protein [Opitutae bacterium]